MNEQKLRLKKLGHLEGKTDGILLFSSDRPDPNFFYLTEFFGYGAFWYDFSSSRFFVPELDFSRSARSWCRPEKQAGFEKFLRSLKGKRIGISKETMSASAAEKLKKYFSPVDVSAALADTRAVKTGYEIKLLEKSCAVASRVMNYALKNIGVKMTERALWSLIEKKMLEYYTEHSFPTIVATGRNIAEPHHVPDETRLGETVLVDLGVKVGGYCSDITRTVGSKYENIIEDAIGEALDITKPGTKVRDMHAAANKSLGKLARFFITGLGHGIGLEVHEKPNVSTRSKDVLKEGMVITIEPGVYLENGIRKEIDVLVTKNRPKILA